MPRQDAFVELIKAHEPIILKIVKFYTDSLEDEADLKQEIIYQLWRSMDSFKGHAQVSSWIYRVALNTALVNLKKRKKQIAAQSIEQDIPSIVDENNKEEEEKVQQLYASIKQLPALDRAIILLYLEEKSHAEIAEIIGLSPTNIGTRIGRIKKKLQSLFKLQKQWN